MNTGTSLALRQQTLILIIAFLLALFAAFAPVISDGFAGTSFTPVSYGCGGPTGGGC